MEFSVDGGDWTDAEIARGADNDDTWVQWKGVADVEEGDHTVRVRAIDKDGTVQTGVEQDVLPDGATGWHSVGLHLHLGIPSVTDFAARSGAPWSSAAAAGSGSPSHACSRREARRSRSPTAPVRTSPQVGRRGGARVGRACLGARARRHGSRFVRCRRRRRGRGVRRPAHARPRRRAARPDAAPVLGRSRRRWPSQLAEDAAGFFNVVHPALPHLRDAEGSVVAVTTAATARYPVRDGLSSAPKAAVEALVRALAAEEGRYGVRVNAVGPGMLTDGMAARLISSGELSEEALAATRGNIPLRRFGTATDIAEAVCFLASDRAGFISGQKLDVDGGYSV